ncbi:MAG: TM2 domain-containing protein [Candidatus Microsaccharimonas sp.]
MQPEEQTQTEPETPITQPETSKTGKKLPRQRHYLATFFISFMWGSFGIDRMYMGYWVTGILKFLTFGGLGLWTLVDFALIYMGAMKDKQGREMLQAAEYKKFAAKTVLFFAIGLGLIILVNGLLIIYGVTQLITSLQDGSGLPGGINLDQLQSGGVDQSQIDSLLNQ